MKIRVSSVAKISSNCDFNTLSSIRTDERFLLFQNYGILKTWHDFWTARKIETETLPGSGMKWATFAGKTLLTIECEFSIL